jgi:hypothetical protein
LSKDREQASSEKSMAEKESAEKKELRIAPPGPYYVPDEAVPIASAKVANKGGAQAFLLAPGTFQDLTSNNSTAVSDSIVTDGKAAGPLPL